MSSTLGEPLTETKTSSAKVIDPETSDAKTKSLTRKGFKGIKFYCMICEKEYKHEKRDDNGNLQPYAICQHLVYKGVYS